MKGESTFEKNRNYYLTYTKTQKGITLVALIVTIVVLLILAVVTIQSVTGDGIIAHAKNARDEYERAAAEENALLSNLTGYITGQLGDSSSVEKATVGTIAGKKSTINGEGPSSTNPVIPEGYAPVNMGEAKWDATTGPVVNKGLVITDAVDGSGNSIGNEWVWIPASVADMSELKDGKNVGKVYEFTTTGATQKVNSLMKEPDVITNAASGADSSSGTQYDAVESNLSIVLAGKYASTKTAGSFKSQLQDEFDSMLTSVATYGGYYVGRYETGGSIANPVLKQGATVIKSSDANSNWYHMYASAKKLAKNNKVTAGMIWGCQWDNALRWLVNSGSKTWSDLTNSASWGNYSDNTEEGHGTIQTAGFKPSWKANNIYDLAGNLWEWTVQAYSYSNSNGRTIRGGSASANGTRSVSSEDSIEPTWNSSSYGFRATLSIK